MSLQYKIFIVLLCCVGMLHAQKYTDKQIGFDQETTRAQFLNDGVAPEDINKVLQQHRNLLEIIHQSKLNRSTSFGSRTTNDGCGNVGFDDDFNEWTHLVGIRASGERVDFNDPLANIAISENVLLTQAPGNTNLQSQIIGFPHVNSDIPYTGLMINQIGLDEFSDNLIMLGGSGAGSVTERITKTITVSNATRLFSYRYAVMLQDPGHPEDQQPYFSVYIERENGTRVPCSEFSATVPGSDNPNGGLPGFIDLGQNMLLYRPASTNSIDLLDEAYGLTEGSVVRIVVEVADCSEGAHSGSAFFEGICGSLDNAIEVSSDEGFCQGVFLTFSSFQESFGTPSWIVYDALGNANGPFNTSNFNYIFEEVGDYTVELTVQPGGNDTTCNITFTRQITIEDCPCECLNCDSFSPTPGEKYVVSAWVHEDHSQQQITYSSTYLQVVFYDALGNVLPVFTDGGFYPSGDIIDGWQRILKEFRIPDEAKRISLDLVNNNPNVDAYFDDIRVHPFNGNMKSFVYDQQTQRLMAELDENNYATFYEYDKEGGLVRVKKETEKGVYTIQETRSGNSINIQN